MATTLKQSYKQESGYIILGNITTDDEESGVISIWEKIVEYKARGNVSLQVLRTAGATDIIEVDIEMKMIGGNWVQVATVTAITGTNPTSSAMVLATGKIGSEIRIIVPTVGTNNVLEVHLMMS